MATEYKLSYTAVEIDEKLGKIDELDSLWNSIVDLNDKVDNLDVGYTLTDADKQDIADLVENVVFYERPTIVSSVDEMTDTSKEYILESTGTVWKYETTTTTGTMTDQIVGTSDNPWGAGRLSSGNPNGTSGYVTTPYIDLSKYTGTFELHLEGIPFLYTDSANIRYSLYKGDKTHIVTQLTQSSAMRTDIPNTVFTGNTADESLCLTFTSPVTYKDGNTVGYARFSGEGAEANANVYIVYEGSTTSYGWIDTGIVYGSGDSTGSGGSGGGSSEEIVDITEFNLMNPSVKSFMDSEDYDDSDYSYTNVNNYASSDYFRKDIPLPIVISWERDATALEYTVSINTASGVLTTGMQTHYVGDNKCIIYNLIPNKTYYYKVYGLYADSSKKLLKSGSFTTMAGTRMLNIEGVQNVRDIGGYIGLNSKKVNYGLIYRGSGMDEAVATSLKITDNGVLEMVRNVGIKTDVDLRANKTASALGSGIDFKCVPYGNYDTAITDSTIRGYFKTLFEYISTQINANKPVYIHCQGGCDRTGTLVFLLLGLLGVSESDLAKEYELSSFSSIGKKTRIRNSTTYKYSGMVTAIKAYEGATITDKFVSFATACGISADTITTFRNKMLS